MAKKAPKKPMPMPMDMGGSMMGGPKLPAFLMKKKPVAKKKKK